MFEEDGFTNCGVGSNLNEEGLCETDGGVMTCVGGPGAVAAAPGIARVSALARHLADAHQLGRGGGALVPPRVLCGQGAVDFAGSVGIHPTRLQTDDKVRSFTRIKRGLKRGRDHDTVGVVALFGGRVACGTSSGGFWMKRAGRVGSSAIPGAGFWCEAREGVEAAAVASGAGEDIISRCLSLRAANSVLVGEPVAGLLKGIEAGIVALTSDGKISINHTTPEMGWAIATSACPAPTVTIGIGG